MHRKLILLLLPVLILSTYISTDLRRDASDPCSPHVLARTPLPDPPRLPAWPFPPPTARPGQLREAEFVTLYAGTEGRAILDRRRTELLTPLQAVLDEAPVALVRQGVWRALWPAARACLADRPTLRLGYSHANRLDPPKTTLLAFSTREGELQILASALWVAPSRRREEPTWVILTALGPMDQRSLIYRHPNAGYTLDGPVTVLALPSSEAARALAAQLDAELAAHGLTEPQAAAAARALAAEQAGDWNQAADAYEELLVHTEREAKEPGPPRPDMPFFAKEYQVVEISRPEVLLRMARADLAAGRVVYGAEEALLHASYLAEEQGKGELLSEIRTEIDRIVSGGSVGSEMHHRLAELEPENAERWWSLAPVNILAPGFIPEAAVAVAEAVGGPDPDRAAAIYLRMAEEAVNVSTREYRAPQQQERSISAGALLNEALRRQPLQPYGRFLQAARYNRLGQNEDALQLLEGVTGRAARHENAIARGAAHLPAMTLDLAQVPPGMDETSRKSAYRSMGYWQYMAKFPQPPAQQAHWSPTGNWLATTCSRVTGPDGWQETDLCLVAIPSGEMQRLRVKPVALAWASNDRLLYSLGPDGLWIVSPGQAPRKLAPGAAEIAVDPYATKVAFTADDGIWFVDLASNEAPRRLTSGPHSRLLWSPDGTEIYYAARISSPDPHLSQQIIYRVSTGHPEQAGEVGRAGLVSLTWFYIASLRWWEPGQTLLVEGSSDPTLLPVAGGPPTKLEPGQAQPSVDLQCWQGFACPQATAVVSAPRGGAVAYRYAFGPGAHLFIATGADRDQLHYLGEMEVAVLGAESAPLEVVPLDWYRQRSRPGQPISWSPDGRYLAWLQGDRLRLFPTTEILQ